MKYFLISETLLIFILCFLKLFKLASSDQRSMDIIDNYIGLAETNNNDIQKRNSIVDGGVFVPYKSTTIVYKSRLVPVTYGFVIKKETLKENPALYKLGVKLLDEKVDSTPKQVELDEKKVEPPKIFAENQSQLDMGSQKLDAKSNCVRGSKLLRLLGKLTEDITKIEKEISAQNQSVKSEQHDFIAKSLRGKKKASKKLRPQIELHVSGHKGAFENKLNDMNKKPQKQYISKNLSRYWQCRRSHTKSKCAMFLVRKSVHSKHSQVKHHGHGMIRGHDAGRKHDSHVKHRLNKHKNESTKSQNKQKSTANPHKFNDTEHLAKGNGKKHLSRHHGYGKDRAKHKNGGKIHPKNHRNYHDHSKSYDTKHALRHEQGELDNKSNKRHPYIRHRRKPKVSKKKTKENKG